MLLLQGQGVVGVLSRDLPSAPGSHINGGDVFFKATVENIHIILRLSLHLSDFSVCLFIYLLDVVYGGFSQLLLIHSPQILVVYNSNTHLILAAQG